jgi:hypothetical protein
MIKNLKYLPIFIVSLLLGTLSSCEDPVEGCLDIAATNFNPAADRDCCCTYPVFQLRLEHRAGETANLQLNQPYEIDGQEIVFRKVAFYISEFNLFRGGVSFEPRDSFFIYLTEGPTLDSVLSRSNVSLVTRVSATSSLGRFQEDGNFERAVFRVGLNEQMNQPDINRVPPGTRLALQADSMHTFTPEGYIFAKANIFVPATEEEIELILTAVDEPVIIDQHIAFTSIAGFNKILILRVNYLDWLENIDFINFNPIEARQTFRQNIVRSLQLSSP